MADDLPPVGASNSPAHPAAATWPRRSVLSSLGMLPFAAAVHPAEAADAEPFDGGATLLVAGSEQGRLVQLGNLIAAPLLRSLPSGTALRRQRAGGDDGVTGANQFEARVAPDGRTVLLLPGSAALAWLAGDPRARFDATRWVPVMTGCTSGILVSRVPIGALPAGASLRVAAAEPAGADVAALLGLDLLRIEALPVFRVDHFEAARTLLAGHVVDAVFLHGENVPARATELGALGVSPLFSLGIADDSGGTMRDPLFPDVPTLTELLGGPGAPPLLYRAWRAVAAAAQLDFALVLPQLTPAALVALWRRAIAVVATAPELQPAIAAGMRPTVAPEATAEAIAADAAVMLELRRWLADRYNWQPA